MAIKKPVVISSGKLEQIQSGDTISVSGLISSWATSTAYVQGDYVLNNNSLFVCATNHTSGTFVTDWLASKWTAIGDQPGDVKPFMGIAAPTGWFSCDGSAKSRTTYATLYNIVTTDKGNFTVTIASPGVVTLNGHGLGTGDCVELTTDGALPTGLSVNTNYYVIYNDANSFWLATSYANALAATKINTSGTQSGTHSLRHCPYGISTSANFLLPDTRGIGIFGAGTHGTMTNANSAAFSQRQGAYDNDKMQGHRQSSLSTNFVTNSTTTDAGAGGGYYGGNASSNTTGDPTTDGTNGTPRTGTETKPASIAFNFIIKY